MTSGSHIFWITSRAAGITALILASVSVSVGLLMGGRLLRGRGIDLRISHEALSLATLAALGVHALSLLGDSFFHPSVIDLTVPFARDYRQPWMAIGIVAGWMLLLLGLSYYARNRIGSQRWRTLHRFTALAWVLGVAHSLGQGTDAGQLWFLAMLAIVVVPALVLLATRWLTGPATATNRRAQPPLRAGAGSV